MTHKEFTNYLCKTPGELCASWNKTNTFYDGCILESYCDLEAYYIHADNKVNYTCINGVNAHPLAEEHHTKILDLSVLGTDYEISIDFPSDTDMIIEGHENDWKRQSYGWIIQGTDCVD